MWILVKAVVSAICHKHRTEYARSQKETETLWMPEWMHIQAFEKWTIKLHLLSEKKSYPSISVCYFVTHYPNTLSQLELALFSLPTWSTTNLMVVKTCQLIFATGQQFSQRSGFHQFSASQRVSLLYKQEKSETVSTYPANKDSVCVWCLCVCMCLREIEGRVL